MKNNIFSLILIVAIIGGGIFFYQAVNGNTMEEWEQTVDSIQTMAIYDYKYNLEEEKPAIYEFENGDFKFNSDRFETETDLPKSGKMIVAGEDLVAFAFKDDKWCAKKSFVSSYITVVKIEELSPKDNCDLPYIDESNLTTKTENGKTNVSLPYLGEFSQYGIEKDGEIIWQKSNIFKELNNTDDYDFHVKIGDEVITKKAVPINSIDRYQVEYVFGNEITLDSNTYNFEQGKGTSKISYEISNGYKLVDFELISGTCSGIFSKTDGTCTRASENLKVRINTKKESTSTPNPTPTPKPNPTPTPEPTPEPVVKYTVTFHPNGGSCDKTTNIVIKGENSIKPNCTKEGYNLVGFTRVNGQGGNLDQKTGIVSNVTGSQTIKANWESNFPCGDQITDSRDNKRYGTVRIGSQCWLTENMSYTGNGCLNNEWNNVEPFNGCDTHVDSTGTHVLYQWGAAMNGSTKEGTQGVCPSGFRVSTDNDWKKLELFSGMSETEVNTSGQRGGISGSLKTNGSSGLNIYYSHSRDAFGPLSSYDFGRYAWIWTSTEGKVFREINQTNSHVMRGTHFGYIGGAVRCVRDL